MSESASASASPTSTTALQSPVEPQPPQPSGETSPQTSEMHLHGTLNGSLSSVTRHGAEGLDVDMVGRPQYYNAEHRRYDPTQVAKYDAERDLDWEQAGEGRITYYHRREDVPPRPAEVRHGLLGQLAATSIAGNDITSSCLYSSGVVAQAGGIMSPFAALLVSLVLFFFRSIYTEACTALPINGGSYNLMLNTTTKLGAALAAVLSLLSYTATAVVSATSAANYLHYGVEAVPVIPCTIVVLVLFAFLLLLGVRDSANTAAVIFVIHMGTMLLLIVVALVYAIRDRFELFKTNWTSDAPEADPEGSHAANLYSAYCMALLGITGFESSSNYIEEQKPGVFAKTLRNMWICVTLLNPTLSVLCLAGLPITTLVHQSTYSLAILGETVGGSWLKIIIIADATLVLCGAVLASYVGVCALIKRLALDYIMPGFLLRENKFRHTNHYIIFFFCLVTVSLTLLVPNIDTLAGVYSISFLGVMTLFNIGTLVLKVKRASLRREMVTPVPQCVFAGCLLLAGIYGQVTKGDAARWFLIYFAIFSSVILTTMKRVTFLRVTVELTRQIWPRFAKFIVSVVSVAKEQSMVFFCKSQTLGKLNLVVQYVLENENTSKLYFVTFVDPHAPPFIVGGRPYADYLRDCCTLLDSLYPKLTIEIVRVDQPFEPQSVAELSEDIKVPRHLMFMGCPNKRFFHQLSDFCGVRVITN